VKRIAVSRTRQRGILSEASEAGSCFGSCFGRTRLSEKRTQSQELTFHLVDAAETLSQLREFEASLQKMMAGDMTLVSELGLYACRRRIPAGRNFSLCMR